MRGPFENYLKGKPVARFKIRVETIVTLGIFLVTGGAVFSLLNAAIEKTLQIKAKSPINAALEKTLVPIWSMWRLFEDNRKKPLTL